MIQQLSLFLQRRNKALRPTGQRPKGPSPLKSLHPNSFSHKNQKSKKITQSISLTPLKQTFEVESSSSSSSCHNCSSSSIKCGRCAVKQHMSTTVSLPLMPSPTVVRQVSYHWQTVQRLTLKSQLNRVVTNRDFGTQTSTEELMTLGCDVEAEKTSLERSVESRRLSAFGNSLRNSFRSSRRTLGSIATLQRRLSTTKMPSAAATSVARMSHKPGMELLSSKLFLHQKAPTGNYVTLNLHIWDG